METIALKIKALNFSEEVYPMVNKFWNALTDDIVSLEDVVKKVNFLNEKRIEIAKPSQNKVLANDFEFIQNQVKQMEELGELDAYREDVNRINSKGAINRLKYLKNINAEYKNEDGKYSKLIFSKKLFEKEYGIVDFNNLEDAKVEQNVIENSAEEIRVPVIEEKSQEEIVIDEPTTEVEKEINTDTSLDNEIKSAMENKITTEKLNEDIQTNENIDPIIEILSKPQTIGMDDVTFKRYEIINQITLQVVEKLYQIQGLNDEISSRLIKLITNNIPDDKSVIYIALTYNKQISEEESKMLKDAIEEEIEYLKEEFPIEEDSRRRQT